MSCCDPLLTLPIAALTFSFPAEGQDVSLVDPTVSALGSLVWDGTEYVAVDPTDTSGDILLEYSFFNNGLFTPAYKLRIAPGADASDHNNWTYVGGSSPASLLQTAFVPAFTGTGHDFSMTWLDQYILGDGFITIGLRIVDATNGTGQTAVAQQLIIFPRPVFKLGNDTGGPFVEGENANVVDAGLGILQFKMQVRRKDDPNFPVITLPGNYVNLRFEREDNSNILCEIIAPVGADLGSSTVAPTNDYAQLKQNEVVDLSGTWFGGTNPFNTYFQSGSIITDNGPIQFVKKDWATDNSLTGGNAVAIDVYGVVFISTNSSTESTVEMPVVSDSPDY